MGFEYRFQTQARLARGLIVLLIGGASCAGPAAKYDRDYLSAKLRDATGQTIGPRRVAGAPEIPGDVSTEDGVSEVEAVAIALWNNPGFQEATAELGLRRADLIQAGLLTNPDFWLLLPLGPKQLEFAARFPVEALWLRGRRIAAAGLDCRRVAELIVENGLDLVRRVRAAFATLELTRNQHEIATHRSRLLGAIATLQEARLRAGDARGLDVMNAKAKALEARASAALAASDQRLAEQALRALLGFANHPSRFRFERPDDAAPATLPSPSSLVTVAHAARPDLRAAELELNAAGERAGLARDDIFKMMLIADANGQGTRGFELGPGLTVSLPVFDQGQGRLARAAAELERTARRYASVRDLITRGVLSARERLVRAQTGLALWQTGVVPTLQAAVDRGRKALDNGDISELTWLGSRLPLLDARTRAAQLVADVAIAVADLERELGRRLEGLSVTPRPIRRAAEEKRDP